jgi:hypothetical protein
MGKSRNKLLLSILFASLFGVQSAGAQETQSTEFELSFKDAESTLNQGLFETFYSGGKVKLGLSPDQIGLDNEYILHAAVISGIDGFFNREIKAGWRSDKPKIVSFVLQDGKFRIVEKTLSFQSDVSLKSDDAVRSNTPLGILAESKIVSSSNSANIFLELDGFFKTDKLLGDFLKTASLRHTGAYVRRVLTYPDNVDIRVRHTFSTIGPSILAGTSHRTIDLEIQYSFIRMPKDGFSPRRPDSRVGYFRTVPSRYLEEGRVDRHEQYIHRWRLEKGVKGQELSPPVSPIVFYIEKSTPENLKPMIRAGVLKWNSAFESLGIRDAIVVKDQPVKSAWDENDINYNVIRWVSSPAAGGSFSTIVTNPRTGEILGANVVIDDNFFDMHEGLAESAVHGNGMVEQQVSTEVRGVLRPNELNGRVTSNFDNSQDVENVSAFVMQYCEIGNSGIQNALFQIAQDEENIVSDDDYQSLWSEFTSHVVAHEVGHALGLTHNFAGSQLISIEDITSEGKLGNNSFSSSVMDYVDPYFVQREEQIVVVGVSSEIGPYDYWAIDFGYRAGFEDQKAYLEWRGGLLDEASKPEYLFGMDGSSNILAVPNDLSDDPIGFSELQLEVLTAALETSDTGSAYQIEKAAIFTDQLKSLNTMRRFHLRRLLRYIGGLETRVVVNGEGVQVWETVPVAGVDQQRALGVISKYTFDRNNRISFGNLGNNLVFETPLGVVYPTLPISDFDISKGILPALLTPVKMTEMSWGEELGGDFSVENYLSEMTNLIFYGSSKNTHALDRTPIQQQYVQLMLRMSGLAEGAGPKYSSSVELAALSEMSNIRRVISRLPSKTDGQRTHKNDLTRLAGGAEPTWFGVGGDVVRKILLWVMA